VALAALAGAVGDRPFWLAACTHPGEEEAAAATHRALRQKYPGLITLIVPRHPARADAIEAMLRSAGHAVARRSRGELPTPAADIYLGDTLGEMGLFYSLAEIVFVGGSLTPVGGHNPLESARLGCAILQGPDTSNCAAVSRNLAAANASIAVADGTALTRAVDQLLADPTERQRLAAAASAVALRETGILDAILECLAPLLDRLTPRATAATKSGPEKPAPDSISPDPARACA
jgi:3-deoxy-D-manno-octulosonic-acid transferase